MHHGMLAKENDLSRTVSNVRVVALQRHAREPYQSPVRDARCGSRTREKMRCAIPQSRKRGRSFRCAIPQSRQGCGIVEYPNRRGRKGCGIVPWVIRQKRWRRNEKSPTEVEPFSTIHPEGNSQSREWNRYASPPRGTS